MNLTKNISENLTDLQKIIILLISSNQNEPIRGRLWLQKEIFLISNNIKPLKEYADFEADYMGPYSEILEEEESQLELDGILETKNYRIELSDLGKELSKTLIKNIRNKEILNIISDFKNLLNDLPEDEMLAFIYMSFPDMKQESTKYEQLKHKLKNLAIRLYKKNKISIGKASEISGIPISEFMDELKTVG